MNELQPFRPDLTPPLCTNKTGHLSHFTAFFHVFLDCTSSTGRPVKLLTAWAIISCYNYGRHAEDDSWRWGWRRKQCPNYSHAAFYTATALLATRIMEKKPATAQPLSLSSRLQMEIPMHWSRLSSTHEQIWWSKTVLHFSLSTWLCKSTGENRHRP